MDARTKKVLILLGFASLVLVWRICGLVTKYMPAGARASQTAAADLDTASLAARAAAEAHDQETAGLVKSQEKAARQPWGRDPFADVIAPKQIIQPAPSEKDPAADRPAPPRITFTGVSRVGDEWRAIVSGHLVRVGDVIEADYRVSRISKRSITMQSRGWSLRYELGTEAPSVERLSEKP